MDKRIFEMPVRVGGVLWLKDEPYKPFHVIGYRIGRMMERRGRLPGGRVVYATLRRG